ncbi:Zinc finger protein [Musa troglodytarum]|uniref:Protein EARLY HEADING DATE 2 n=2 Tax=Musa troglodytarum TaxID=320322 RepID=A0A9E7HBY1_9LILI|nr:Zinc finger protein [Musa troglodytarum]
MGGEAISSTNPPPAKKKRSLPGTPDPEAEVIALSPKTLLATNRFLCEICGKGFQRDQNLQLHRRGHNLPWKLRQRTSKEPRKRVYVCPEKSCVHHHPSRALGDLTGIKKHFCRKHGEKKWKCDKCSKRYAVQSDCKAHSKTCGTREYRCDCGTVFSRRDSFITHRAFCDALAEESARVAASNMSRLTSIRNDNFNFTSDLIRSNIAHDFSGAISNTTMTEGEMIGHARRELSLWMGGGDHTENLSKRNDLLNPHQTKSLSTEDLYGNPFTSQYPNQLSSIYSDEQTCIALPRSGMKETESPHPLLLSVPSRYSTQHHHQHQQMAMVPDVSATALLQKAALIGVNASCATPLSSFETKRRESNFRYLSNSSLLDMNLSSLATLSGNTMDNSTLTNPLTAVYSTRHLMIQKDDERGGETRDFLGVDAPIICASSWNGWV